MPEYKGVEIASELIEPIRNMPDVEDYRDVLARLQSSWDTLTMLGQLSGSAAEMSGTREGFAKLTGELLNLLASETLRKRVADLRAKSQNSADILVRNLFERTADIGFLAADTEIGEFLQRGAPEDQLGPLRSRFREYVAKYSVYSDIVLFDTAGAVVARLADTPSGEGSHDLAARAMTTTAPFLEVFGEADFLPPGRHLVYAHKVAAGGRSVGALALVFRLADEMEGIFGRLLSGDDWTVLGAISPSGEVVASSSDLQLPRGSRVPAALVQAQGSVVRFGGRRYLAFARTPASYQGYEGPGWLGLAMIPLEFAFESVTERDSFGVDRAMLADLMDGSSLFPGILREIPRRAAAIQEDLNRSVWNGSVRQSETSGQDASFAKTLLWEVSDAGRRTQEVFEHSIGNLQETVMAALLEDVASRSAFAIDVMDRNLYERANDCRWWALDGTFRRELSRSRQVDARACAATLRTINDLYTVYETLVLFDLEGRAVAVSRAERESWVGTRLEADWVERTLSLRTTQNYAVSSFQLSTLYGDRHTVSYTAAVRDASQRAVGGVAVVFDAEPQFAAMLSEALPRDEKGEPLPGSFALFLRPNGSVISSSDPEHAVGTTAWIGATFADLAPGSSRSVILEHDGVYHAVGATMSAGYREFKTIDGYSEPVIAVCGIAIGRLSLSVRRQQGGKTERARRSVLSRGGVELATFLIGDQWFGVLARNVIEATTCGDLVPMPSAGASLVVGMKLHNNGLIPILRLEGSTDRSAPRQAVIMRRTDGTVFGLVVDALAEVPEVADSDIRALGAGEMARDGLASHIVPGARRGDGRTGMLLVLDVDRIAEPVRAFARSA